MSRRRRFIEQMIEDLGLPAVIVAGGSIIREVHFSDLPDDEGVSIPPEEITRFIDGMNLRQLRALREVAEDVEVQTVGRVH